MNEVTIITNKRIIVIAIVLSLSALTVLTAAGGGGLASDNIASAQSIPSNQGMVSPFPLLGPFLGSSDHHLPSYLQLKSARQQTRHAH
jgi:hypothetical protein